MNDQSKPVSISDRQFADTEDVSKEIRQERYRQITVEGHSAEFDDLYDYPAMAQAAACYCRAAAFEDQDLPFDWPWEEFTWKPSDSRTMLIKAGALIVAEIERMDRYKRDN